ncbi:hypothetical protein I8F96_06070 [Enterococcus casseliflavus]|nr:hypothetical protein [Enterococcus casseliflavus]
MFRSILFLYEVINSRVLLIFCCCVMQCNVHSFVFEQMDYVIGTGEVEVSYRDAATNEEIIPSQLLEIPFKSEAVLNPNSGIDDEPYLLGYDYSHVETDALYFDERNNTIKPETERRNVTYFF